MLHGGWGEDLPQKTPVRPEGWLGGWGVVVYVRACVGVCVVVVVRAAVRWGDCGGAGMELSGMGRRKRM